MQDTASKIDHTPRVRVSTDLKNGLVRFSASGLWGEDQIKAGSAKIGEGAAPFIMANKPWAILADYSEAIVQPREVSENIRKSMQYAVKVGLQRIAVINSPPLVRMQYQRMSDIVETKFFEDRVEALLWLRT